ncbi:MAG: hypothetical protein V3W00_01060 [Candidatus Brocadiales bacterium]
MVRGLCDTGGLAVGRKIEGLSVHFASVEKYQETLNGQAGQR